jgi:hypothetical protein
VTTVPGETTDRIAGDEPRRSAINRLCLQQQVTRGSEYPPFGTSAEPMTVEPLANQIWAF